MFCRSRSWQYHQGTVSTCSSCRATPLAGVLCCDASTEHGGAANRGGACCARPSGANEPPTPRSHRIGRNSSACSPPQRKKPYCRCSWDSKRHQIWSSAYPVLGLLEPPAHPYDGVRVGEAANPGPPDDVANRRDRTLHALAQMGLLPPTAPLASDAETLSDTLSAHAIGIATWGPPHGRGASVSASTPGDAPPTAPGQTTPGPAAPN